MSRAREIIDAYEEWDPESESIDDLVARIGISKARLYQVLDREGVTPKSRRPQDTDRDRQTVYLRMEGERSVVEEVAEHGLRALLQELELLRREVAEYRERYGPLDE